MGPPTPSSRRVSSSLTLLAGLAILLLALGTGVLIGHSGGSSPSAQKPKINVYVNGASGSGASGVASTSSTGGSTSSASSSKKSGSSAVSSVKASSGGNLSSKVNSSSLKTQAQRNQAAAKVSNSQVNLGNGKKLASQNQKVGGSCTAGTSGCENGKFTGNFFGGG